MSTLFPKKKIVSRRGFVKVGIDEAGRGPLAGPLAVGAVVFFKPLERKFKGIRDSKKMSETQRERWLKVLEEGKRVEELDFSVGFSSNREIDKYGISEATRMALGKALDKLKLNPRKTKVFLDGLLKAPPKYVFQKTVIKGDEKIKVISLASVVAKVYRDREMKKISMKYKNYGFEKHKGYGTKSHLIAIKKHKVSPVHRKTFLKNFLTKAGGR